MAKKVKIEAWQKFQNPLLTQYNVEQLAELKRSNWSGLLLGIDQLYSTMYHEWDSLQKDVNDIAGAVRTLEWTVMPYCREGEMPTPEAQEVARVVTDALWKREEMPLGAYSHSFPELVEAMVHAVFRGFNVHQIEWANDGKMVYPARYIQLPPQFLIWETGSGKPDRLLLVPDGQSGEGVPFEQDRFIVALNNSGPDHPVYNATFYSLVNWFLAYKFGLGWFMQFTQKFGMPKQVFHYTSPKDKEQLLAELEDERAINSLFIRGDRKYELVNAPQGGASLPQAVLLERAEQACHKAILGQTLTSDTSAHGGSLAQAKVHAGVRAELVLHHAEFIADVLNRQLIPAIVRANYGRVEGLEMPELRCKLPKTQANIELAQAWQAVLQIPGMKVKKSEVYESLGVTAPEEGEDVFEAPAQDAAHGGMPGMEAMGEDAPALPEEENAEEIQTAKKKIDAAQAWLEPLKKQLREARANGASLAEIREQVRSWKPDTKALAGAFAENIERGLTQEDAEVAKAANPYGCNQYGEGWKAEHEGLRSEPGKPVKKKTSEDDSDNKETTKMIERMQLVDGRDVEYNGKGGWSVVISVTPTKVSKATVPYKHLKKEGNDYKIEAPADAKYKVFYEDESGYFRYDGEITGEELKADEFDRRMFSQTVEEENLVKHSIEHHVDDGEEAEKLNTEFYWEYNDAGKNVKVEEKKGESDAAWRLRLAEARYRAQRKVFDKWRKKYPYDPVEDGWEFAELEGSYKQQAWADKIRRKAYKKASTEVEKQMRRIKSASWWIDNRDKKTFTLDELKKAMDYVRASKADALDEGSAEFVAAYEAWMSEND